MKIKRKTKTPKLKCLQDVKYTKEFHHTCNNPEICKIKIHPDKNCKNCIFYKLLEVEVADEPQKDEVDWGF